MTTVDDTGRASTTTGSTDRPDRAGDPLTTVFSALLGALAVAAASACGVYAIWWLVTYWAPT